MGYKRRVENDAPRVVVPCAHDLCPHPAICRIKLEAGWANLCRNHYDFHIQREADKFCHDNGLRTLEQKREYCREKMSQFGKLDPTEHWKKVLATDGLPPYTYECAREALELLRFRGKAAA